VSIVTLTFLPAMTVMVPSWSQRRQAARGDSDLRGSSKAGAQARKEGAWPDIE